MRSKLPLMKLPELDKVVGKFIFPRASNLLGKSADSSSNKVVLNGWLHRKPKKMSKNLTFAQVRDPTGKIIQVTDHNSPSVFRNIKQDSILSIKGSMESEFKVDSLQVLNHADMVSGQLADTKDWPAQYRYVQLRQPDMQEILRKRSSIIKACRDTLVDSGFTEVETPLLFKSTPEGAREFLVPTRKKGAFYALPQSPQQYKQLLIASGIDKYFQVAKCFRDEDLRVDRQPEFTQLDMEMGFANHEDVQAVVRRVVTAAWKFTSTPLVWREEPLLYSDAIENYGIDKPDLRYSIKVQRLAGKSSVNNEFPVLEALVLPNNTDVSYLADSGKYASRMPRFLKFSSLADLKNQIEQTASIQNWEDIAAKFENCQPGQTIAIGDRRDGIQYENPTPLGRVRQLLIENQPDIEPVSESVATWVTKFPLFEPIETSMENGYPVYDFEAFKSTHHPFTMVDIDDYNLLEENPLGCHGQHFDLVIDGVEVGGGSTRVHDPEIQLYIFQKILKIQDPQKLFGHLLSALAAGCPPHAGLAIGLDRMVAMICNRRSIRDVVAFPKTISGADPMIGSPSKVTKEQLYPYAIKVN